MKNNFKCKANNDGYCDMWLRSCVGVDNCQQGTCPYCVHAGISPTETICTECKQGQWKKENYID